MGNNKVLCLYSSKVKVVAVLATLVSIVFISCANSQHLRVASYNIRYNMPSQAKEDSIKGIGWPQRHPVVTAIIKFHDFDIVGTQECLNYQINDMQISLPGYAYVGVGRDDGNRAGEYNAIFYKKDRFKVLKQGTFWLSETPEKPSMGWNATCCHRICTWVLFEDVLSTKQFYVFNTHFDYQKTLVRNESSNLILKKIEQITEQVPVILVGDFNGDRDSEWYKKIADSSRLKDAYQQAKFRYANNGSFNGFGTKNNSSRVIDHIFLTRQFQTHKWAILTDTYYGRYPSDHFPVMVEVSILD